MSTGMSRIDPEIPEAVQRILILDISLRFEHNMLPFGQFKEIVDFLGNIGICTTRQELSRQLSLLKEKWPGKFEPEIRGLIKLI